MKIFNSNTADTYWNEAAKVQALSWIRELYNSRVELNATGMPVHELEVNAEALKLLSSVPETQKAIKIAHGCEPTFWGVILKSSKEAGFPATFTWSAQSPGMEAQQTRLEVEYADASLSELAEDLQLQEIVKARLSQDAEPIDVDLDEEDDSQADK